MAPHLIEVGRIQVVCETSNSVVYAVDTDSPTDLAKDSRTVLKAGTIWYQGEKIYGDKLEDHIAEETLRHEAHLYQVIGNHPRFVSCHGLELLDGTDKPWAMRLERVQPGTSLRNHIVKHAASPPAVAVRVDLATQLAQGLAHLHSLDIVWSDLSTRNALLASTPSGCGFDVKLCDLADSEFMSDYFHRWYGCEVRYCPPGPDNPAKNTVGTMNRELFALGSAICEITEWAVPYGHDAEHDDVEARLRAGELPRLSEGNPAGSIIRNCWGYRYGSAQGVAADLEQLLSRL